MEIDTERYEYIERLSDRRIEVQSLLIDLGKVGVLLHPFKVIKLRKEAKRLDRIDQDISKISLEFYNSSSRNVGMTNADGINFLESVMRNYMENNPIDEVGIFAKRRVKALK